MLNFNPLGVLFQVFSLLVGLSSFSEKSIASDGRVDDAAVASIGACIFDPMTGVKEALWMTLPKELEERWSGRHCIM